MLFITTFTENPKVCLADVKNYISNAILKGINFDECAPKKMTHIYIKITYKKSEKYCRI